MASAAVMLTMGLRGTATNKVQRRGTPPKRLPEIRQLKTWVFSKPRSDLKRAGKDGRRKPAGARSRCRHTLPPAAASAPARTTTEKLGVPYAVVFAKALEQINRPSFSSLAAHYRPLACGDAFTSGKHELRASSHSTRWP